VVSGSCVTLNLSWGGEFSVLAYTRARGYCGWVRHRGTHIAAARVHPVSIPEER
jgi:hypothetical protein